MFHIKLRQGNGNRMTDPQPTQDVKDFWKKSILKKKKKHLGFKHKNMMQDKSQTKWENINADELVESITDLSNCKVPGLDQMQNLLVKIFQKLTTIDSKSFSTEYDDT